jgi:Arc/MetJ-type ribon-helix-helix transcriptional regulator
VKAGDYTDASEVVRDAVRQMQAIEATRHDRHALAMMEDPAGAASAVREGYEQLSAASIQTLRAIKN